MKFYLVSFGNSLENRCVVSPSARYFYFPIQLQIAKILHSF